MKFKRFFWILPLLFLLLVGSVLGASVAPDSADTVAYWKLENSTDSTGNGYTLTNNGATLGTTGIINNAFSFDGTDDYVQLPAFDKWSGFNNDFTISGWLYLRDNTKSLSIIQQGRVMTSGDLYGISLGNYYSTNKIEFYMGFGTTTEYILESSSTPENTWIHVTATYVDSTGEAKLYLDGTLEDSATFSTADVAYKSTYDAGAVMGAVKRDLADNYGDGNIDEVAIFNVSLTADEVSYLYNSGSPSSAQQYPFTNLNTNFTVFAVDFWDDSSINNFTVEIVSSLVGETEEDVVIGGATVNFSKEYFSYNVSYGGVDYPVPNDCLIDDDKPFNKRDEWLLTDEGDEGLYCVDYKNYDAEEFDLLEIIPSSTYTSFDPINITGFGDLFYLTTTGSVTTNIPSNASSLYSFIVDAPDYFLEEYDDINVSSNFEAVLHQSEISFESYDLLNNSLSGCNYTISGIQNTTFYLSAGEHTVLVECEGYLPVNHTFNVVAGEFRTEEVRGLYSSDIIITPKKIIDNSSINNFEGYLYNIDEDYNVSFSSTNGSATIKGFNNDSYFLSVSSDGDYVTTTKNFTVNSSEYLVSTYHYTFNSVRINIYNGTTNNLLIQNVSINVIYDSTSFSNSTTSGNIIIDFLDPEDYELRFSSDGFLDNSIFISVTNDSTQEINIYMISNDSKELQQFIVYDQVGQEVSGAIIRLQKEVIGGEQLFYTVDEKTTGSDGKTAFYVTRSTSDFYRMIVIYNSVVELITDKTLFIPGINDIISLNIDTSTDSSLVVKKVTSNLIISGEDNETVTFSWVDPLNSIVGARLDVYYRHFNVTNQPPMLYRSLSSNTFDGSLNVSLPVVNDSEYIVRAYIVWSNTEDLVHSRIIFFGKSITVNKGFGLLIGALLFLFISFITVSFKPLFSSIISLSLLGILSGFNLISIPVTVITSFIALAIIFFIKLKKGGQ